MTETLHNNTLTPGLVSTVMSMSSMLNAYGGVGDTSLLIYHSLEFWKYKKELVMRGSNK